MAQTDRPWFWYEVASHRWAPNVADYLTEETVTFLESCHFPWPLDMANFGCSLAGSTDEDCEAAAAVALGTLRIVFGHASALPLEVKTHIPATPIIGTG